MKREVKAKWGDSEVKELLLWAENKVDVKVSQELLEKKTSHRSEGAIEDLNPDCDVPVVAVGRSTKTQTRPTQYTLPLYFSPISSRRCYVGDAHTGPLTSAFALMQPFLLLKLQQTTQLHLKQSPYQQPGSSKFTYTSADFTNPLSLWRF